MKKMFLALLAVVFILSLAPINNLANPDNSFRIFSEPVELANPDNSFRIFSVDQAL